MQARLTIIVAVDAERGIGIDNAMPWRLREDMAHFKQTTSGHPVIMGRKTFDSIGKPLPKRRNIVITRNPDWQHEGVESAASLEAAIALVGREESFIMGGAQIYQAALPYTSSVIVTEIDKRFACDAFFPALDPRDWREVTRETHFSADNDCGYAFVTYRRLDQ
ncbi:MAG: dihydrofolate reductase [Pseudomonadota bacterium]